jgi:phage tail sheath protein FI
MIIDAPRQTGEEALVRWIGQIQAEQDVDASYGALYFPWLRKGDVPVPPSGVIAGVYARVEADSSPLGVRAAPANVPVHGFSHLDLPIAWRNSSELIRQGINPILSEPGRGLMVWGARTMSRDPKWQQVTARRIVSFITERIRRDAEWVVFEHQRPELWETVSRMVHSRLDGYWNAGLLTGETAGSDYLVQCDEELNPPKVRDAGQVHFRVVLRPISATEFIEVELQLGQ